MSVLIKDMDMPSCCGDCQALDDSSDYPMCRFTHETTGYNFEVYDRKMSRCPLVDAARLEAAANAWKEYAELLNKERIESLESEIERLRGIMRSIRQQAAESE